MKQRFFLCLASVVFAIGNACAANLIANGDFETGDLNGWTVGDDISIDSSAALSGSFSALFNANAAYSNGTLSQSFTTVPGAYYAVSFKSSYSATCTITGSDGATLSNTAGDAVVGGFVANSATTTITFSIDAGIDSRLDNVQVQANSFSKPGKYTGTVTYLHYCEGMEGISSTKKYAITARIDSFGRLAGFDNNSNFYSAIVSNAGVLAYNNDNHPTTILSFDPVKGVISFKTQESWSDDVTGLNRGRVTTVSLKYAGK